MLGPFCVAVVSGPDQGLRLELPQGTAVVGTSPNCDLVMTDPRVSRQHLKLSCTAQGLEVLDLDSRNGTQLNGARVREAVVQPGTRLKLGDSELEVLVAQPSTPDLVDFYGFVGRSPAARAVVQALDKAARSDETVLLTGETGTGKEAAARAIHLASARRGPLVTFDCASVSGEVLPSELFGHARGAFTGAEADRLGAVARAERGTLFLDEVGELPPALQPSLLRLLERREFRPVGSDVEQRADVRVIAATHRDLAADVEAGRFRRDLYFRLAVLSVPLPPLRERLEDLALLAQRLLTGAGHSLTLSEPVLQQLQGYDWPGNVRELRNVLLRAVALGTTPETAAAEPGAPGARADAGPKGLPLDYRAARELMLERFEKAYLAQLLSEHQGNVTQAAKTAGIARSHLYRLLSRHGLV
ncbi:MAG: sigma 54-interacting transcriptional regulator [Archangiaceae bacterium]|nr:sigma 54-interacting transcriptional regulator [Archangiaceae bacterium]